MVNYRWMRNGFLAALVAYGVNAGANTKLGYDSVEASLKETDTITDNYVKKFMEPTFNLIDESTGVNLNLNRYSFAKHDDRWLQGIAKGSGLLQIAGLGVLAAGLFKKKE